MWKCRSAIVILIMIASACASRTQQATGGSGACVVAIPSGHSNIGIGANKVACTLPQLYGVNGLNFPASGDEGPIDQHPNVGSFFEGAQEQQALLSASLNSSIAGQIALLPFVAPASGITFTFDKTLRIYAESQDSFGPLFSERATTIGRHRFAVGFSYQYLDFDTLGGVSLKSFPTVFIQTQIPNDPDENCPAEKALVTCLMRHDYVTASNRVDLKIHQLTSFVTFGLTRRVDISVAIPVNYIQMAAVADAAIESNSGGSTVFSGCNGSILQGDCGLQHTFSNSHSATGLGDVIFRGKGMIRQWERAGLAAGVDVRFPTGDATNLLGTGAFGIKPFAVWSYSGRLSPHVNVGYEWNGQSILGGDVTTGKKASLPSEFIYSVGVEGAVVKQLTVTLDLLGQRIFNGPVESLTQVMAPSPCTKTITTGNQCADTGALLATLSPGTSSYGMNNGSVGVRIRPFGNLLVSASVQLKLDSGGLRSKASPMVSATYTIR